MSWMNNVYIDCHLLFWAGRSGAWAGYLMTNITSDHHSTRYLTWPGIIEQGWQHQDLTYHFGLTNCTLISGAEILLKHQLLLVYVLLFLLYLIIGTAAIGANPWPVSEPNIETWHWCDNTSWHSNIFLVSMHQASLGRSRKFDSRYSYQVSGWEGV